MTKLSKFGSKFGGPSGITGLMEDLGNALNSDSEMIMMGGGNPAHIPEVEGILKSRLEEILHDSSKFKRLVGIYDPPQGEIDFITAMATLLNREYGWQVTPKNIALTNGSQAGFFMLFNMFAGAFSGSNDKQILLPLAPEYIGYSDSGITDGLFKAYRPDIHKIDGQTFKYQVDFQSIDVDEHIGAICVSRPTNPTGNVLTDLEISKLDKIARANDVPLIIDGAYGTPFPNLIFTEAQPHWNDNTIVCLSLSKLGLPAVRTGIVVANEAVISALAGANAIMNLATGSFGPMLTQPLVASGEILSMSQNIVRPFYLDKAKRAEDLFKSLCHDLPVSLHKVEGAMFLWLWMKDCPITSEQMYQRLKSQGVLVVSGHHFFPGLDDQEDQQWQHRNECLRVTYSQDEFLVERGIRIIANALHDAYQDSR